LNLCRRRDERRTYPAMPLLGLVASAALDLSPRRLYAWGMKVHFTPEQEAQLSRLARDSGKDAEHLVKGGVLRLLEDVERFREGVRRGIAAAERGEFVDSARVWANVEAILRS
jgi:predicted transcriptional regulator